MFRLAFFSPCSKFLLLFSRDATVHIICIACTHGELDKFLKYIYRVFHRVCVYQWRFTDKLYLCINYYSSLYQHHDNCYFFFFSSLHIEIKEKKNYSFIFTLIKI